MKSKVARTIRLLYETILFGAKEAGDKAKPYTRIYIKGLLFLVLIAVLSPIPFLIIGILGDWKWLIGLTGLWWASWAFLLLLAASPIGILIESLTDGIKGSGQRYVKRISGVLLTGLCVTLFASLIPIKANLDKLPQLIVAVIILGILNVWLFSRKVIAFLVTVIFIALILSFYFPTAFKLLGETIGGIDLSMAEPKRLYPTFESVEKGEFRFFRPDDKPRVWYYYRTEDKKFEFFDREGPHPIYKEKLKPVTPDTVPQILKQLKEEQERKAQEDRRRREEAEILEKQRREETERIARQKQEEIQKVARQEAELPRDQQKVFSDSFLFSLDSCVMRGKDVQCYFTVLNDLEHDRELALMIHWGGSSRMFDNLGNEYVARAGQVGSRSGTPGISGLGAILPPKVTTKASLAFENVRPEASVAALLRVAFESPINGRPFTADFRDVPLEKR